MTRARFQAVPATLFALAALGLQGCSVYFNTYFNAEKAYNQGIRMRAERQERNPEDTTSLTPEERAKLTRAVTKSSKVLELWPNHPTYAPKAVFLIAESQLLMGDYGSAAQKYDEYIRYFPREENIPMARVHRAQALYLDGRVPAAREALEDVLDSLPRGEARREALLLSARMRIDEQSGEQGLALYEQLLAEGAFTTPEARNEAHWRAALVAFELEQWERARNHALAAMEGDVPARTRYRNRRLAVQALYRLGRHAEGLAEVRRYQGLREFRPFRADLKVMEGQGAEGLGDWPAARRYYHEAVALGPNTPAGAEAWYRIGARALDVENREDSARVFFDSSAAASRSSEYGEKAADFVEALKRLAELRRQDSAHAASFRLPPRAADTVAARDTTAVDSIATPAEPASGEERTAEAAVEIPRPESVHSVSFLIAELFHFRLPKPDSARVHLNRIVADSLEDSVYSRRAYYALAYLEENVFGNKARADSLYRAIMARYPATEWAKQAERNLGLPPRVETPDDKAHALFLAAERRRLALGDSGRVPPAVADAYRAVARDYPSSPDAAKALFVLAFLTEEEARARPGQAAADSAKAAYAVLRDQYPGTPYAEAASTWIEAMERSPGDDARETSRSDEEEGADYEAADLGGAPRREQLDAAAEQDLY